MSCTSAPGYTGTQSDHFDGKTFRNREPMNKSATDLIKLSWGLLTEAEAWPEWLEIQQQTVPQERVDDGLSITFVNHATFLIQVDGLNILTDPVYSERVSPFRWAGPKRVHAPGIALEDLPPIDVILISHNLDHVFEVADRVQVMRGGKKVGVRKISESSQKDVLGLIVGSEASEAA